MPEKYQASSPEIGIHIQITDVATDSTYFPLCHFITMQISSLSWTSSFRLD